MSCRKRCAFTMPSGQSSSRGKHFHVLHMYSTTVHAVYGFQRCRRSGNDSLICFEQALKCARATVAVENGDSFLLYSSSGWRLQVLWEAQRAVTPPGQFPVHFPHAMRKSGLTDGLSDHQHCRPAQFHDVQSTNDRTLRTLSRLPFFTSYLVLRAFLIE